MAKPQARRQDGGSKCHALITGPPGIVIQLCITFVALRGTS